MVRRSLESARLLTLTGPGGVGKTQLGLRVARQVRRAFADGVWLVELAALQDPGLLAQSVADALGLRDQSVRSPLAVVADYLRDKELLLVLDNCEHLLEACGLVVAKLLGAAGGLRVLATSRQVLRLEGEHVVPVGPLSVPDPDRLPSQGNVHQYEAVRLFAERAVAVVPGFEVDAGNRAAVVGVCHRLDGMPLAIELAVARLRVLSPEQLLQRLDDRFRLLVRGPRFKLLRHRTLRATIDWSFDLCEREEQALWARASVFAGGFDLDAAEAVCGDGGIDRDQVLDLVAGLMDKSILVREGHGYRARYRMLDTIHAYGRDRLRESGEEATLRRWHRDYYLGLAELGKTEWFGPDQVEVFRRTQREHANLRIALEFCLSTAGETRTGLHMAAALHFYWVGCGFMAEGRRWFDRALAVDTEPSLPRAAALWANAHLAGVQGAHRSTNDMAEECHALGLRLEDETSLAWALLLRGHHAMMTDDQSLAVALYVDALARFEALGKLNSMAIIVYILLVFVFVFLGDFAQAVTVCRQGIAICEPNGELWVRSYLLYTLGWAEWSQGEMEQATVHARESLSLKKALNDLLGMAVAVDLMAWIAAAAGDGERAATLLGAVGQLWESTGGRAQLGSPAWIVPHDACERQTRKALGDHAFRAAFARGYEFGLDETVAYALGEKPQPTTETDTETGSAEVSLTRREQQVAELVAEGLTNKQIADRLVIAQRTAEGHVERILAKLGFTKRVQIAAWMAEQPGTRGT
ncbi:non-specific serine/threonine protein kinase [Kibdelosporangium banguiense]|uniref:Non-specific serine/threonine protein kinase n=1 Tax=Kibdelosporangium banguiense TaxID=1365924 RepID=A0ABS4TXC4_9PSEU|nr:LuxR C-terminal-related transcriptional regulator [Kibdelosporangium banguiense]MBP2329055.1 non-specific serine/threonine protein kinase [Kibdelosporangium banguiense]